MERTVCVIGGGVSGIVSVKHCIEAGLLPTCYESSTLIGGLWNSGNEDAVPDCTVTNTSKELSAFSDFPMPEKFPNFMHSEKLMDYFDSYVAKHNLMRYICLGCEVKNVDLCTTQSNGLFAECARSSGKYWKVTVQKGSETFEACYDFLVVATGFNRHPYVTDEVREILKGFTGKVIHSSKYRSWKSFENQKVLVYGFGNSGGDIASELSRHASQAYMATKHGSYVLSRLHFSGYPWDAKLFKRYTTIVPECVKKRLLPMICNSLFDHINFGLEPLGNLSPNPIINDQIWTRIATGSLLIKPNVVKTHNRTVYFSDGSKIEDIDSIVLCTGYKRNFSFLKNQELLGIPAEGKFFSFYDYIFPTSHAGKVAVIGVTGVGGSVFPVFEMQSRYAAEVFRGAVNLPSVKVMEETLQKRFLQYQKVNKFQKEPLWVNYISYQDEIAEIIGVKPCIWKLLYTDPVLAFHLLFGPCIPYQYRLVGPGSWNCARDAILSVNERIWSPFRSASTQQSSSEKLQFTLFILIFFIILGVIFTTIF